jgi:hypothetical protein
MSVTEVTYWKGGKPDQVIPIAREAKGILTRHGATSVQMNRVHAGPEVGQWAAVIGYSGWEAYGRAREALANDAGYQALLARASEVAEVTSRRIVVGVEL